MSAVTPHPHKPSVLMVDDESVARTLLEYYLKKNGFQPIVAESAAAARKIIGEHGPAAIDCVVTDYNMPGESGLELLLWLKQTDPALSVIMITATTEREFVAATLRGGASDFLDKPITEAKLTAAVTSGVASTVQKRRLTETERAVQEVGKAQHQMFGLGREASARLDVCYHPCHAAGGDFINFFQISAERFLVLTGDVSGHDLNAAFVSAYFQGMVRGMVEAGQPITRVLEIFNQFLLNEWGERSPKGNRAGLLSVCVCAVTVDQTRAELSLCNHGIPQTRQISATGRITQKVNRIDSPLGWFDDLEIKPTTITSAERGQLLVWTDGLEDLADVLGISSCSLATGLLRAQQRGEHLPELALAKDDILVVRIHLAAEGTTNSWLPVLHERYHGGQSAGIDDFQLHWDRSLQLALPDLSESRRFDVLLTARETVINGIKHGCGDRSTEYCSLTISAQTEQRVVRVMVSDSGPGHNYDWKTPHQSDELVDLHRGLALIHRIATQVTSERNGADLTLDFSY